MKTEQIQIEYVAVSELRPADYNPRKASEKEYNDLKSSITTFGLIDPIIVNSHETRKNIIIGGHFRFRIAKDLGYTKVPVTYVSIADPAKERELNIRLNKNLGEFDYDLLANFDETMLEEVGFDSKEIDRIFQASPDENDDEVPEAPEVVETNPGIYIYLGDTG